MFPDRRQLAAVYAEELTSLGDPCSTDEALALTPSQCVHRLWVARRDAHARAEVQRLDERTTEALDALAPLAQVEEVGA